MLLNLQKIILKKLNHKVKMEKTDDDYRTKNAIRRLVSKIAMHIDLDLMNWIKKSKGE